MPESPGGDIAMDADGGEELLHPDGTTSLHDPDCCWVQGRPCAGGGYVDLWTPASNAGLVGKLADNICYIFDGPPMRCPGTIASVSQWTSSCTTQVCDPFVLCTDTDGQDFTITGNIKITNQDPFNPGGVICDGAFTVTYTARPVPPGGHDASTVGGCSCQIKLNCFQPVLADGVTPNGDAVYDMRFVCGSGSGGTNDRTGEPWGAWPDTSWTSLNNLHEATNISIQAV